MEIVRLDEVCRNQQVKEGWFATVDQVPERVIALTISALFCVRQLSVSVLTKRKAHSVRRTLEDPLSTDCPATILRTYPNVTMCLDPASAGELYEVFAGSVVTMQRLGNQQGWGRQHLKGDGSEWATS